jgi:hypothetical protein
MGMYHIDFLLMTKARKAPDRGKIRNATPSEINMAGEFLLDQFRFTSEPIKAAGK